jgi:hypothetical protein
MTAKPLAALLGVRMDQQNPRRSRVACDVVLQKRFGQIDISAMPVRHFLEVGVQRIVANAQ